MSVAPKRKGDPSASWGPGTLPVALDNAVDATAPAQRDPRKKTQFAPGIYYRQGVRVDGGPRKGPTQRGGNR